MIQMTELLDKDTRSYFDCIPHVQEAGIIQLCRDMKVIKKKQTNRTYRNKTYNVYDKKHTGWNYWKIRHHRVRVNLKNYNRNYSKLNTEKKEFKKIKANQ